MVKETRLTLTVIKVNLTGKPDKEGVLHKELVITARVPFSQDRLEFLGSKIGEPLTADLQDYQARMAFTPAESQG